MNFLLIDEVNMLFPAELHLLYGFIPFFLLFRVHPPTRFVLLFLKIVERGIGTFKELVLKLFFLRSSDQRAVKVHISYLVYVDEEIFFLEFWELKIELKVDFLILRNGSYLFEYLLVQYIVNDNDAVTDGDALFKLFQESFASETQKLFAQPLFDLLFGCCFLNGLFSASFTVCRYKFLHL